MSSPSPSGRIELGEAANTFAVSFDTGKEFIKKTFPTLRDSTQWLLKMDASKQIGHLDKGMSLMSRPPTSDQVTWLVKLTG